MKTNKKTMRKSSTAKARRQDKKARRKSATRGTGAVTAKAKVNSALLAEAGRIKKLIATNDKNNALKKYVIATRVQRVMDGEKEFGAGAVKKLGRLLRLEWQLLYRWAEVARAWPTEAVFRKVISQPNKHGIPLTWSHLEALTKLPDNAKRERLIKLALAESLSVRELKEKVSGPIASGGTKPLVKSAAPMSIKDSIIALTKQASGHVVEVVAWQKTLRKIPDGQPSVEVAESLAKALVAHNAMIIQLEINKKKIEAVLGRAQPTKQSMPTMATKGLAAEVAA